MESVVVSVRIKKDTKAKLENEGVDVEEVVKEFLNNRAAQIELRKSINKLKKIVEKEVKASKKGFSVRSVREDRRAAN